MNTDNKQKKTVKTVKTVKTAKVGSKQKAVGTKQAQAAQGRFDDNVNSEEVKTLALHEHALQGMQKELAIIKRVMKGYRIHILKAQQGMTVSNRMKLVKGYLARLIECVNDGYSKSQDGKAHGPKKLESFNKLLKKLPKSDNTKKLKFYLEIWDNDLPRLLDDQLTFGEKAEKKATKDLTNLGKKDESALAKEVKEARKWLRVKENAELHEQTMGAMKRARALEALEKEAEKQVKLFANKDDIRLMVKQETDLELLIEMFAKKTSFVTGIGGKFQFALTVRGRAEEYQRVLADKKVGSEDLRKKEKIRDQVIALFYKSMKQLSKGSGGLTKYEQLNDTMMKKWKESSKNESISKEHMQQLETIVKNYIDSLDADVASFGSEFLNALKGLSEKAWNVKLEAPQWKDVLDGNKGFDSMEKFTKAQEKMVEKNKNITECYAKLFSTKGFNKTLKVESHISDQIKHAKSALKVLTCRLNIECDPKLVKEARGAETRLRARLDHDQKVKDMKAGALALKAMKETPKEPITDEKKIRAWAGREDATHSLQTLYEKKVLQIPRWHDHFKKWVILLTKIDTEMKGQFKGLKSETQVTNKLAKWDVSYAEAGLPGTRNLGYSISTALRSKVSKLSYPIKEKASKEFDQLIDEKVKSVAEADIFGGAETFLKEMRSDGSVLWPEGVKTPKTEPTKRDGAKYFLFFWDRTVSGDLKTAKTNTEKAEKMMSLFNKTLKEFFTEQSKIAESEHTKVESILKKDCDSTIRYRLQGALQATFSPSKLREEE